MYKTGQKLSALIPDVNTFSINNSPETIEKNDTKTNKLKVKRKIEVPDDYHSVRLRVQKLATVFYAGKKRYYFDDLGLTRPAAAILEKLLFGTHDINFVSAETLAIWIFHNKRTVIRSGKMLEQKGLISVCRTGRKSEKIINLRKLIDHFEANEKAPLECQMSHSRVTNVTLSNIGTDILRSNLVCSFNPASYFTNDFDPSEKSEIDLDCFYNDLGEGENEEAITYQSDIVIQSAAVQPTNNAEKEFKRGHRKEQTKTKASQSAKNTASRELGRQEAISTVLLTKTGKRFGFTASAAKRFNDLNQPTDYLVKSIEDFIQDLGTYDMTSRDAHNPIDNPPGFIYSICRNGQVYVPVEQRQGPPIDPKKDAKDEITLQEKIEKEVALEAERLEKQHQERMEQERIYQENVRKQQEENPNLKIKTSQDINLENYIKYYEQLIKDRDKELQSKHCDEGVVYRLNVKIREWKSKIEARGGAVCE